jgi:hypothetical protein
MSISSTVKTAGLTTLPKTMTPTKNKPNPDSNDHLRTKHAQALASTPKLTQAQTQVQASKRQQKSHLLFHFRPSAATPIRRNEN